jgi:hypothetical protein
MSEYLLWAAALLIAPYLIAKADLRRRSAKAAQATEVADLKRWWKKEGMPSELRGATLFLNEQEIRTDLPVPMHGRVDQVFKTPRGVLVPVDTKCRDSGCVFKSDIIQLSVYRVILQHRYGSQYTVSGTGYVRAVTRMGQVQRIRYLPVRLLPERRVVKMWHRYTELKEGRAKGKCTCEGKLH